MNEWAVFGVLAAIASFLAVIVPPIIKLTGSITKLTTVVETLDREMNDQRKQNKQRIDRLWAHNEEQDEKLCDHETRLQLLERCEG